MEFTKNAKILLASLIILAIIINGSVFIVKQNEQALVLQFGKPVGDVVSEPGLYFKMPYFIQEVIKYDKRILEVNLDPKTLPDVNQKQVNIDAFVKYKIDNALKFYQTVQTYRGLDQKVDSILMAGLKNIIGQISFQDLLSEKRSVVMRNIQENIKDKADEFGVDVIDLRIVRADLPEQNANSIFNRMIAEREKEAREYRARGEEKAKNIMARAEKERTILLAEAKKEAETTRGEGDAKAVKIYANAYGKDVEFFNFYKSMQAYKKVVRQDNTSMILSPDSEFLKYIKKPQ